MAESKRQERKRQVANALENTQLARLSLENAAISLGSASPGTPGWNEYLRQFEQASRHLNGWIEKLAEIGGGV